MKEDRSVEQKRRRFQLKMKENGLGFFIFFIFGGIISFFLFFIFFGFGLCRSHTQLDNNNQGFLLTFCCFLSAPSFMCFVFWFSGLTILPLFFKKFYNLKKSAAITRHDSCPNVQILFLFFLYEK